MLIAGEASGDILAAELVEALQASPQLASFAVPPDFIGAGGPGMAAAGVSLELDLTQHAVFGISDALTQYWKFRGLFQRLFRLAVKRQPDVIILVDFSGFNRRFARAIQQFVRGRRGAFHNWNPKLVYYVSPQVWASRASRADQLARDVDLLLSIFPFEKTWYAARVPQLRVEFVGHPLIDRHARPGPAGPRPSPESTAPLRPASAEPARSPLAVKESPPGVGSADQAAPLVLLLPGSRRRELVAHLPVLLESIARIRATQAIRVRMILPNSDLASQARQIAVSGARPEIQVGGLSRSLGEAKLAIASSGTVTLECACFRVPTIVIYRTSWPTYWIARQIVQVPYFAMPNLLAGERLYPEFIQSEVTVDNITREARDLLTNARRRSAMQAKLSRVIDALGEPGASVRAANHILRLLPIAP